MSATKQSDLGLRIRQNMGFSIAVLLFVIVYFLYHLAHPKGFSSQVLVQNSNEVFSIVWRAICWRERDRVLASALSPVCSRVPLRDL